ncbi:MAG: dual specificity protein phosphatase family protein [Chloroflexota bacterium]
MRITWIDEHICGSGIPVSTDNLASLKEQGVQAIVTLTEHPLTVQKALRAEVLAEYGFTVLHVPVVDQYEPTIEQTKQVYDFVQTMSAQNKPTLLHCHAGVGRTGTMLHAVYLWSGMSLDEAKALIKAKRPTSQFFMLTDVQKAFLEQLARHIQHLA